jgi:hypothetical protein
MTDKRMRCVSAESLSEVPHRGSCHDRQLLVEHRLFVEIGMVYRTAYKRTFEAMCKTASTSSQVVPVTSSRSTRGYRSA